VVTYKFVAAQFTVWSLHENQTTVRHSSVQAGTCTCQQNQGPLNHTDNTGSAAVTSKFNCNRLMHDLHLLQCLSFYYYCVCELYKKQTHWTDWDEQTIGCMQKEADQTVTLLNYLWIIYVKSALFHATFKLISFIWSRNEQNSMGKTSCMKQRSAQAKSPLSVEWWNEVNILKQEEAG